MLIHQSSNITANYETEFLGWVSDFSVKLKQHIENKDFNQFVVKALSLFGSLMGDSEY